MEATLSFVMKILCSMQGNIPGIAIPDMPGSNPAALEASKYTVPDDEFYITLATAGIYGGEFDKAIKVQDLRTEPIGKRMAWIGNSTVCRFEH